MPRRLNLTKGLLLAFLALGCSTSTSPSESTKAASAPRGKDDEGSSLSAKEVSVPKAQEDEDNSSNEKLAVDPHAKKKGSKVDYENDYQGTPTTVGKADRRGPKPRRTVVKAGGQPNRKERDSIGKVEVEVVKPNWYDRELSKLQGTWRLVDTEYDGQRITEEAKRRNLAWVFDDEQYTIMADGKLDEVWTVKLNASRKPKTIDGTIQRTWIGPIAHKKLMGIYEVTDDTLRICYDLTGNGRPDNFKAPKGSRRACYIFER
jgi:uncharacterized protein (TIGR03067 family)